VAHGSFPVELIPGAQPLQPEREYPAWWKPSKFNGVLSKRELDEMANADCRFLDEEAV